MGVEMGVGNIVGDVDDYRSREIAKAGFQSLEQVLTELIVLPKSYDLAARVRRLDIVGVNAALGPERRLPTHRPWKPRRIAQLLVPGSNEKLGDFPVVQV